MPYTLADLPALGRTAAGRAKLLSIAVNRAAPLLNVLASVHRRNLVRSTKVIAVTGTFGKTTTSRAIVTALGGTPDENIGWNSRAFLALSMLRVRPGQRHAVIEVGVTGPEQMAGYARLVNPHLAVVTSIGSEHSRSFASLEATRHEKADLVRNLGPSSVAFVNADDPHVRWIASQTRARVVTYGFGEDCDIRASDYRLDWPDGATFVVHTSQGRAHMRVRLLGRHQVYAALAATAVGLNEGVSVEQVASALESLAPTPGRLEPIRLASGAIVLLDCFKSAEETIQMAADVLAEIPARRKIVVMGEVNEPMGQSRPVYRRLGAELARGASRAIVISGEFSSFASGARQQGLDREALTHAKSIRHALSAIPADLGAGDVLIKGRASQRIERVFLGLQGREVQCEIKFCDARLMRCHVCPMLERGWKGLRALT